MHLNFWIRVDLLPINWYHLQTLCQMQWRNLGGLRIGTKLLLSAFESGTQLWLISKFIWTFRLSLKCGSHFCTMHPVFDRSSPFTWVNTRVKYTRTLENFYYSAKRIQQLLETFSDFRDFSNFQFELKLRQKIVWNVQANEFRSKIHSWSNNNCLS